MRCQHFLSSFNKISAPLVFAVNFLTLCPGASALTNTSATEESIIATFSERIRNNGVENIDLMDFIFFGCVILLGLEIVNCTVKFSGRAFNLKRIPVRGKHLDDFETIDILFITLNKIATVPFIYFLVRYMYHEPNALWSHKSVSLKNTLFVIPPFFIVYDFFYTLLHWGLHIQSIYGYIHKHHHRQKAPSRANVDAVNVHPLEFFLGEYNHLLAIFILCHIFGMEMHVLVLPIIFLMAAVLAGLNHTRFDSKVEIMGMTLYDSKWHDVHHRIPQSNYGQYINLWDRIFGTFRMYDSSDRVNPNNQLDLTTGKSISNRKTKSN